ncbi:MAG TPA: AsmA family protein, partial [Candidatus Binatia bacterium]|nr:AsmA family protein [Candidatus Binatia bacterium]
MRRFGRRRVVLAIVVLLLVVRIALPSILRRVIVSQADGAVAGHLAVGDVDLWLLRGALALEDVALRDEGAAETARPLVAFRRMYVNVGWFALLRRTVRVQDFTLDGITVDVDRLRDGQLVVPRLRPAPAAEPPPEPAEPGTPWSVVVDHAALADGRFRVHDHVVDPPEDREIALDALALSGFSLQVGQGAEPAHGVVEAKFGDGVVRVKTRLARRPEGFAAHARLEVEN